MSPWISIIVPSFNQGQYLDATLWSILEQRVVDLEIILVDGGSTDGSIDIIRRHADRLAWWVSEPDRGQSHALNKGFARAKGEWLGWLNSDDLLLPGALTTLRQNIESRPDREWWIGGGYFIDGKGRRRHDFGPPIGLTEPQQLSDWRRFWFSQPSAFFRRRLFEAAGGQIREDLHYALDLELWLRLLEKAPPGFIEAQLSVYRLHAAGKSHTLSVPGELEIVRVIADRLGLDAVLDRVRCMMEDRADFERKHRRLEKLVRPLVAIYSPLKRMLRGQVSDQKHKDRR